MSNLSEERRKKMLGYLESLKAKNTDDNDIQAINEIELALTEKRYGLVWEEHSELVDEELKTSIPVFTQDNDRTLLRAANNSCNFLIEGDNLHSLYLLEKTHLQKIDIIYIDPPYNTGKKDFVYDDCYVQAEDSFKHSKWLSFMDKRLRIAKRLLKDTGVLFASIDDHEYSNLKSLLDEIFGPDNYVGTIIQNKLNSKNDTANIQRNHEYILVYRAKKRLDKNGNIIPNISIEKSEYIQLIEENGRLFYLSDPITTRGDGGELKKRINLGYTFYYNPNTHDLLPVFDYDREKAKTAINIEEIYTDNKELIDQGYIPIRPPKVRNNLGAWTWDINRAKKDIENLYAYKGKGGNYTIKKRIYINDENVKYIEDKPYYNKKTSNNSKSIIEFSTNEGTKALNNVLQRPGIFNNPKSVSMIKELINMTICGQDSIILDFFAGSGTTGQAVLELNKEDGGNRNFILCTNNENNICTDVTYPRLRTLITGTRNDGSVYHRTFEKIVYEKKITKSLLKPGEKFDSFREQVNSIWDMYSDRKKDLKEIIDDNQYKIILVEKEKSSELDGNLLYYGTSFVPRYPYEESVNSLLLQHTPEMIQLQNMMVLNNSCIAILDEEEIDQALEAASQGAKVYIADDVFINSDQLSILLEKGCKIESIPEYYFNFELKEVGE